MTTAAVVAYHAPEGRVNVSYAGHPPILYRRSGERFWSYAWPSNKKARNDSFPKNIPLAIELDTFYEQFSLAMTSGDRLFVYTDGILDTPSPSGENFGLTRLKNLLDTHSNLPLHELKVAVLKALRNYSTDALTHDDTTLMALEII